MVYVPIENTQTTAHTYGVNWTSAALTWLVDGAPVRTLLYEDAKGGSRFPQTPMKLKVGVWVGGDADTNAEGTVTWAMGGKPGSTNYADGPFSMVSSCSHDYMPPIPQQLVDEVTDVNLYLQPDWMYKHLANVNLRTKC